MMMAIGTNTKQKGPINDAQRRLYNRILEKIQQEEAENIRNAPLEESYEYDDEDEKHDLGQPQQTPGELQQQEEQKQAIESWKANFRKGWNPKKKREEEAASKIERRKRLVREEYVRKSQERDDRYTQEVLSKSHPFFILKSSGKQKEGCRNSKQCQQRQQERQPTGTMYFGDVKCLGKEGWIPHGEGTFIAPSSYLCPTDDKMDGMVDKSHKEGSNIEDVDWAGGVGGEVNVWYNGGFHLGRMHGIGTYCNRKGDIWTGTFRSDHLHGIGRYSFAEPAIEKNCCDNNNMKGIHQRKQLYPHTQNEDTDVFYYRNKRICFANELETGSYIRLWEEDDKMATRPKGGIIVGPAKKRGHFRIQWDSDGSISSTNLSGINFEIDKTKGKVIFLPLPSILGDDDNDDTHHRGGTRTHMKCIQDGIDDPNCRYCNRTTKYQENFYFNDQPEPQSIQQEELHSRNELTRHLANKEQYTKQQREEAIRKEIQNELECERIKREKAEREALKDAELHEEILRKKKCDLKEKRRLQNMKIMKNREDSMRWNDNNVQIGQ